MVGTGAVVGVRGAAVGGAALGGTEHHEEDVDYTLGGDVGELLGIERVKRVAGVQWMELAGKHTADASPSLDNSAVGGGSGDDTANAPHGVGLGRAEPTVVDNVF